MRTISSRIRQLAVLTAGFLISCFACIAQRWDPGNGTHTAPVSGTELVAKRTGKTKVFEAGNGHLTAVIGSVSQHYRSESGTWKDIDLRLTKSDAAGFACENVQNTIKSYYPPIGSLPNGIRIQTQQGTIGIGAKPSVIQYDFEGTAVKVSDAKTIAPDWINNQVIYRSAFPFGSIMYETEADQVKCNLILDFSPATGTGTGVIGFSETVKLPDGWSLRTGNRIVTGETVTSSDIIVVDQIGIAAFIFPLPQVFEQRNPAVMLYPDGLWSVAYRIVPHGNEYEVEMLVPLEWLTDKNRNYPVVIDPTVALPGNWGGWQDGASYNEGNPSQFVFSGLYTGTYHRAYTKFNTAAIPDNAEIRDVRLELYQNASLNTGPQTLTINDITGSPGPYSGVNLPAYQDFNDGTYATFTSTVNGNYGPFDLGPSADTNLRNRLGSDWFQIALTNAGDYKRFTSNLNKLYVTFDTCIIASFTQVNVMCSGDTTGSATVLIDSVIAPPYTYLWSTVPPQTGATATGLSAGSYTVTVTDSSACSGRKNFNITASFTAAISSWTNVLCNGDSSGVATVSVSGGYWPYTYSWDDPKSQTTQTAIGLPAGTIMVVASDSSGCKDSSQVVIMQPAALTLSTSATGTGCSGGSDGTASVVVTGGVAPYSYSWNDPATQSNAIASGLSAGSYSVVVADGNGCKDSANAIVAGPPADDVGVIAIDAPESGCGLTAFEPVTIRIVNFGSNTQISIPVFYSVNGGPIISDLIVGNLVTCDTVIFTFIAPADLSVIGDHFIDAWSGLLLDGNSLNDSTRFVRVRNDPVFPVPYLEDFEAEPLCSPACPSACILSGFWINDTLSDDMDWTVDEGGTSSLSTGPSADHTLGTPPGNYVYTEASLCNNAEAMLLSPCIDIGAAANPYLSFWYHMYGADMGILYVDIYSGGSWTDGIDTLKGNKGDLWRFRDVDLGAFSGVIRVRFRGITGISFTSDMALDDIRVYDKPPDDAGLIMISSPVSGCSLSSAEPVTIAVRNFGLNLQDTIFVFYQINSGPIISDTIFGSLMPGDTALFTFADSADLTVPGLYSFNAWAFAAGDGDPANDSITGYLVASVLSVSSFPYFEDFESGQNGWMPGGTLSTWAFGLPQKPVIDTAASGVNAWVTGGLGLGTYNNNELSFVRSPCFDLSSVSYPVIRMKVWWNAEFSFDGANLQSSVDLGKTWQKVGSFGNPNNWYNDNSISGLVGSGSQEGWTGRNSSGNGSAGWLLASRSVSSLGGQPSVLFRVIFGSDASINDDGFGFDDFEIIDAVHCYNSMKDSDEVYIDCGGSDCLPCYCLSSYSNTSDEWISNVSFNTINNNSGSTTYSDFTGISTVIDRGSAYGISVRPYVNGGWIEQVWVWIDWNRDFDFLDPGEAYDLGWRTGPCTPCIPLTGSITVPAGAVLGDTRMRVIMQFSTDPLPCSVGTFGETEDYTVTVTDNCFSLAVTGKDLPCFGDSSGFATISISGGAKPYTFLWNDPLAQTDSMAVGLSAGTYKVKVSDAGGCEDSMVITLTEPPQLVGVIADSGNVSCFGSSDAFAVAAATGGIPPYTFNWVSLGIPGDSAGGLPAGTYTNMVTDSKGCTANITVTLSEPALLNLTATGTNETCPGLCDGAIASEVTGGSPGYSYTWSNGSTQEAIFGLCTGSYMLNITDNNGCGATDTVVVSSLNSPLAANAGPDLSICAGDSITIGGSPTSSDSTATIAWTPDDSTISASSDPNPVVYPPTGTSYTVKVHTEGTEFILTDLFDFGEDVLSHNYADSGAIQPGSYSCNGGLDSTMRMGTCISPAGSFMEFTAGVSPGTDSLLLRFDAPWTGSPGGPAVYVDGVNAGVVNMIGFGGNCSDVELKIGGLSGSTQDGQVVIRLTDEFGSCAGDGQIALIKVYSKSTCVDEDSMIVGVNPSYLFPLADTICSGDSIFLAGSWQSGAGSYVDSFSTVSGCDSVIITSLTINNTVTVYDSIQICDGDSAFLGGAFQNATGTYTDAYLSVNGCDSTINTYLLVIPPVSSNRQDAICDGDSIMLGGNYQTTAGTFVDTFTAATGCDSLVNSTLVVNPVYNLPETAFICANDSILLGGSFQTASGTYTDTYASALGCDSVVTTALTVNPNYLITDPGMVVCSGDSILIYGAFQSGTGTYYDSLTAVSGCDSVRSVVLTVAPAYSFTDPQVFICDQDSVQIYGVYRTVAGTYYDTLATVDGCDSVRSTLLSVYPAYNSPTALSICANDSAFLAGAWQSAPGVYADSLVTVNGCDSLIMTTLAVAPVFNSSDTAFICSGDSLFLAGAFQSVAGSYVDSFSTSANCDSIVNTVLLVGAPLGVVISPSDASCNGSCDGTALSTVSGGNGSFSYAWNTSPVQTTQSAMNLCAGNYSLTITDGMGCQVSGSTVIGQPAPVIPVITSSTEPGCFGFCNGAISAFASGGTAPYFYLWNDPGSQTNSTAVNLCAGTFMVSVTDSNGCAGSQSAILGEPAILTVSISGNDSICAGMCNGSAIAATTGGTAPLVYTWSNGSFGSTITSLCTGTYSVVVSDSNGCTVTDTVVIVNYPAESAAFSYPDSAFCQSAPDPVPVISGNAGGMFSGSLNLVVSQANGVIDLSASSPGLHYIAYTTGGPCPASDTVTVTVVSSVPVSISTPIPPVCELDTATLQLSATPSGGMWSGLGITDSLNGVFDPSLTGSGLHAVIYSLAMSACPGSDTALVLVRPAPSITLSGVKTICQGGSAGFQMNILGIGPFDIVYTDGTGTFVLSGILNGDSVIMTPIDTTVYTLLSLVDSAGCSGIFGGSLTVNVVALPPPPLVGGTVHHCEGDPVPLLVASPQSGGSISWYTDTLGVPIAVGPTFTPPGVTPGYSYYYVTEFLGSCSSHAAEIELLGFSQGNLSAGNDVTVCLGKSVQLLATGGSSYSWYPAAGLSATDIANPVAGPDVSTTYHVIATVNDSCYYEDSVRVKVDNTPDCGWYVYNGFTPNGDGDNDRWIIDGIETFPDNAVTIFNRWEDVVRDFKGYNNTSVVWDGMNEQGNNLPEGTYFYIINAGERKISGWVQLTR